MDACGGRRCGRDVAQRRLGITAGAEQFRGHIQNLLTRDLRTPGALAVRRRKARGRVLCPGRTHSAAACATRKSAAA